MPTHDMILLHFRKMLLRVSIRVCIILALCTLDAINRGCSARVDVLVINHLTEQKCFDLAVRTR